MIRSRSESPRSAKDKDLSNGLPSSRLLVAVDGVADAGAQSRPWDLSVRLGLGCPVLPITAMRVLLRQSSNGCSAFCRIEASHWLVITLCLRLSLLGCRLLATTYQWSSTDVSRRLQRASSCLVTGYGKLTLAMARLLQRDTLVSVGLGHKRRAAYHPFFLAVLTAGGEACVHSDSHLPARRSSLDGHSTLGSNHVAIKPSLRKPP